MAQPAILFDGDTATERYVTVAAGEGGLELDLGEGRSESVPPEQLVRLYSVPGQLRIGRRDRSGWRLVVDGSADAAIAGLLPRRTRSLAPPISRKAAALSVAASALVLGMIASLFVAPQLAARQMPLSLERRIGDSVKVPAHLPHCVDPQALAALNRIVDRLDPEARSDGFTVEILEVGAVNAAALPGGRIVVLGGLIDAAGNGDVVAGVLAHEIAHVRRRHVASAAVRQIGIASLVSLLGGRELSSGASGLLSLKFDRDAESEADDDAIVMLQRAGINPRPTAYMFEQFGGSGSAPYSWLASHPSNEGRAKAFASSWRSDAQYRPALTADEEEALFRGCRWPYVRYGN